MAAQRHTAVTNQDALTLFLDELKAASKLAGLKKSDELAARLGYSASLVRMVMSGHRTPQPEFAAKCDETFGTPGTFARLERRLRDLPFPASYRPFIPHEKTAVVLRIFEPAVITGLFQTEDYARGLLVRRPYTADSEVEDLLAARLARQDILAGENPPVVYAVFDEAVLHRQVASAEVMREQLARLAHIAQRPNVLLQIIPFSAGPHVGLQGGFTIAEVPEQPAIVFLDNIADGDVSDAADTVAVVIQRFEALRADALSRGQSRDLITKVAGERWNSS
jgi:Domain of unknown function (DUF5753)